METKQITLRSKTVKCPYCGEYYSVTYKQCPFCDGKEREKREERRKARREQERASKKETGLLAALFGSPAEKTPAPKTQQKPKKKTGEEPEQKGPAQPEKRPERKKPPQEHKSQTKTERKPERSKAAQERKKQRERKKRTPQREKTKVPVAVQTEPQQKDGPVFDTMTVPDTFRFFDDFETEKPIPEEESTFAPDPISEEPPQVVLEPTQRLPRDIPVFVPEMPPETPLSPDLSGSGEVPPEDPAERSRWEFLQNFTAPEAGQETGGEATGTEPTGMTVDSTPEADSMPSEETLPPEEDLDTLLAEVKDMLAHSPVPKLGAVQTSQAAAAQEDGNQPAEVPQAQPEEVQPAAAPAASQEEWTPDQMATAQPEEEPTRVIPTATVTAAEEAVALSEEDSPFIEDVSNPFRDPALAEISTEEPAQGPESEESVPPQPEKPRAESYEDLFQDSQSAPEAASGEPVRRERSHRKRKGSKADKRARADRRAKGEAPEKGESRSVPQEQGEQSDGTEDLEPESVWTRKEQPAQAEAKPHAAAQRKKRKNQGGRIVWIIVSLAIIVTAIFILVKYVKPIFQSGLLSGSQTQQEEGAQSQGDFEDTAENIALDQSDLSFTEAGATITLNPIFSPEGSQAHLTWTSSDANVAMVDGNGLVTTVAPGAATITAAMANGQRAECAIRCNWNPSGEGGAETAQANGPALNLSDITLESKGKTQKLEVTGAVGTVTWSSSKTDVATVASDGTITAVEKGSTAVTAEVDGQTLTCKVRCIW